MTRAELKTITGQARSLGLSARSRLFNSGRALEIKTPFGTLRRFWSPEQWAEYYDPALEMKRKQVAHV